MPLWQWQEVQALLREVRASTARRRSSKDTAQHCEQRGWAGGVWSAVRCSYADAAQTSSVDENLEDETLCARVATITASERCCLVRHPMDCQWCSASWLLFHRWKRVRCRLCWSPPLPRHEHRLHPLRRPTRRFCACARLPVHCEASFKRVRWLVGVVIHWPNPNSKGRC